MSDPSPYRFYAVVMAAVTGMAFTVFLAGAFGAWLDARLGTTPWMLLALSLVALVVGFAQLIFITKRLVVTDDHHDKHHHD